MNFDNRKTHSTSLCLPPLYLSLSLPPLQAGKSVDWQRWQHHYVKVVGYKIILYYTHKNKLLYISTVITCAVSREVTKSAVTAVKCTGIREEK